MTHTLAKRAMHAMVNLEHDKPDCTFEDMVACAKGIDPASKLKFNGQEQLEVTCSDGSSAAFD